MNKARIQAITKLSVVVIILSLFWVVYAINTINTWFKTTNSEVVIDAHGTCQRVRHTGSQEYFVPTKSSTEWNTFRSNKPAGIQLNSCASDGDACGTDGLWKYYGGYCWYTTDTNRWDTNCDTACAWRWGCNISWTRDFVGSNGTLANCKAVLDLIYGTSTNPSNSTHASFSTSGCHYMYVAWWPTRNIAGTTTCDAFIAWALVAPDNARVCACWNGS